METTPGALLADAARLSNPDLLNILRALAGAEREATVAVVAHLAELDRRRLYLGEGYGSLFTYCTGALRLAEHSAYNRIEAARAVRRFPVLLDELATGALNLSTLRLLTPHLEEDNVARLLSEARGRSKREVEALVARLSPLPDVPSMIRKLPAPSTAAAPAGAPVPGPSPLTVPIAAPNQNPAHRPVVAPLAPERFRVQFTVGKDTNEKLRQVQDLLRREIPSGDPGAIFDRALTLLLQDIARRKLAETTAPRPGRPADPRSRHVPAEVKRAVWLRDAGRCAFVAPSGRRCAERAYLEFHHLEPYALGGETTAANLALRCRAHNAHEADFVFGPHISMAREEPGAYVTRDGGADSPRGESTVRARESAVRARAGPCRTIAGPSWP